MQNTRILLADDNPAILDSVARILRAKFIITGVFTNSRSLLENVIWLMPDIIILDISMGDLSGIEVARCLKRMHCQAKVIFLTVHDDFDFIQAAFAVGAAAYVPKSGVHNDLITAIRAASHNMLFYPQALLSAHLAGTGSR